MGIIVFCQILKNKNHLKTSRHRLQKISKSWACHIFFSSSIVYLRLASRFCIAETENICGG